MALTEEQARVKAAYEAVTDVFPSAGEAEALAAIVTAAARPLAPIGKSDRAGHQAGRVNSRLRVRREYRWRCGSS